MNSTHIFSIALDLSRPWYVEKVDLLTQDQSQEKELHLYINFERGFKFETEEGEKVCAYDTVERQWQHLNFFQHRCYLHARVPRIKHGDGKIHQVSVPSMSLT